MSVTMDTLKIARRWQNEHGRPPEVVLISEARLRTIAGEAMRPDGRGPLLTPADIDQVVRDVRTGEDYCRIGGLDLGIDDTLDDDTVVPSQLPRSLYAGIPGGRIVGPEGEALALQGALNDPTLQVAFDPELDEAGGAHIVTRALMEALGVDHPVLVLPGAHRTRWLDDPSGILKTEYTGPLPPRPDHGRKTFTLVSPKPHK